MSDSNVKMSIITCCYNSAETIRHTLTSVANQSYENIEHIVVDGLSTDDTLAIVKEFPHVSLVICEKDKNLFEAWNKGIRACTGTYVGILNSDDFYPDNNIVSDIVKVLIDENVDSVIGDIRFVSGKDLNKTTRYYSAKKWNPDRFAWGYMPPHPSFYVKKEFYDKLGLYREDYNISSDYELLIRFLYKAKISYKYIDKLLVTMIAGGMSNATLKSRIILNWEIVRACKAHNINTNLFKVLLKIPSKLMEYVRTSPSKDFPK